MNNYQEGNLYCYKRIAGKPDENAAAPIETSQQRLHAYLNWAETLLENCSVYCLIRYSPDLASKPFAENIANAHWMYNVYSNDFEGLGVDKGFEETSANKGTAVNCLLCRLSSPQQLKGQSEDAFGDFSSHLSFFGLQEGREADVKQFLSAKETPDLNTWLQPGEVFIHITVGKEQGYYDAFLVKSGSDLSAKLAKL